MMERGTKAAMRVAILTLCLAGAAAQDICEKGGHGMMFPLFSTEYQWPNVRVQSLSS